MTLFKKYKEPLMYLIFGVLTTAVNYITYIVLARLLGIDVMLSNGIAYMTSIVFAYITNRTWVFTSYAVTFKARLKEAAEFVSARLFGFVLDMGFMFLFVSILDFNDLIMKGLSNVIVIGLNYVISKYIIFKPDRVKG